MAIEFLTAPINDPRPEYARRLELRRAALRREQQRSRAIWFWRRVVFALIVLALVLAFEGIITWWLVVLPVVVFIALMAIHQRIHAAVARFERAVRFYERGLARIRSE